MTANEIIELFQTEGFTVGESGTFVRDGLEMNLLTLSDEAIAVRFLYPLADAQGTLHLLIDAQEWREPLLQAIQSAEQVKRTAIEFFAATHRHTGC